MCVTKVRCSSFTRRIERVPARVTQNLWSKVYAGRALQEKVCLIIAGFSRPVFQLLLIDLGRQNFQTLCMRLKRKKPPEKESSLAYTRANLKFWSSEFGLFISVNRTRNNQFSSNLAINRTTRGKLFRQSECFERNRRYLFPHMLFTYL